MVGIFSRFSGFISKPHLHPSHKSHMKLEQVGEEGEEEEEDGRLGNGDARGVSEREEEEGEAGGEFKPISHPLEPQEDDRPTEYPSLPFSYLVNDRGEPNELFAKSLSKMAADTRLLENEDGVATQTPKRRSHSLPQSTHSIFQVFNQCKQTAL